MFSPYEELEYLADYLPDEGEMVLVTRQSGELVCKPWSGDDLRDGIHDAGLYGFLVQANEQLAAVGTLPIWVCLISISWLAIILHAVIGFGWSDWFLTPGLAIPLVFGCFHWIRARQHRFLMQHVLPNLRRELYRRRIDFFSLLAGVRQHSELRTLLDELVRLSPANNPVD